MKTLRLILGDQLNPNHSWFKTTNDEIYYVLMEVKQETSYVLHHAQKIIAIFAAMRDFKGFLLKNNHHVIYIKINDKDNQQCFKSNLNALLKVHHIQKFEYQEPDESRLDKELKNFCSEISIPSACVSSEHFYTSRDEVKEVFKDKKQWLMESFYRYMRKKHHILMNDINEPIGSKWNFDNENRKAWKGTPKTFKDTRPIHDHSVLWDEICNADIKSFGENNASHFQWPLNRQEALKHFDFFVKNILVYFGDYQDAMHKDETRMFHSLVSFALNTKMLSPHEVILKVERSFHDNQISINTAEGFIRQILGWREYIRGYYWANISSLNNENYFNHQLPVPSWFWNGQTQMNCLKYSILQSLNEAYAHHIQRLMVIGNFSLLAGIHPQKLHQWYLGIYIDAFEWVEMPNTLGMSQFADGGKLASKPYVSTANYVNKMSNYCEGCHYSKNEKIGEKACPFNSLYWNFFLVNAQKLGKNPRLGIVYKQLRDMDPDLLKAVQSQARQYIQNIETL
jgi:deoxyribodipyrimidine photolyase-related protein